MAGRARPVRSSVCAERLIRISLNGLEVGSFETCIVGLPALAVGYLLCAGLIRSASCTRFIDVRGADVQVTGVPEPSAPPVPQAPFQVEGRVLFERFLGLEDLTPLARRTGGTHCAALFTAGGGLVARAEDVSRLGSVSLALGQAAINRSDLRSCFLLMSGRASPLVVAGAARLGLPLVVCGSTPTAKAVGVAQQGRVGLAVIYGPGRMLVYCGRNLIRGIPEAGTDAVPVLHTGTGFLPQYE